MAPVPIRSPPPAMQLLAESGEHARTPVPGGHQRDAARVMILEHPPRGEPRLVLGRQRVLVELRGAGLLRGQEIQRQQRCVHARDNPPRP